MSFLDNHDPNIEHIAFSPDNDRVACVASDEKQQCVLLDGTEGNWYNEIYSASSTSKVAFDEANTLHYLARRGEEIVLVTEGFEE